MTLSLIRDYFITSCLCWHVFWNGRFSHAPNSSRRSGDDSLHHVPRSEYLFKLLQPTLEDLLFLGKRYERYFDEFEVLLALAYIDETRRHWGPIGRFGYKHSGRRGDGPYKSITENIAGPNASWELFEAGIFDIDDAEFKTLVQEYTERLNGLHWL